MGNNFELNENFNEKLLNAAKWSSLAEFIAKLVVPITNMILARILVPEAFGVIATISLITSFMDMISDAGFQKYLIQSHFSSVDELGVYATSAFWANMTISLSLWVFIFIFSNNVAYLLGDISLSNVLKIASFQVIFTAFSAIQFSLIKRSLKFKMIFMVRVTNIAIPFIVTIPLAFFGLSYWSIIIGNFVMYFIDIVIMSIGNEWRPNFNFDFTAFKKMINFSLWNLIESLSIWMTGWIDIFLVGRALSQYELGLYKTSTAFITSLMGLVTASIIPVLFSGLSRLKEDEQKFNRLFLKTQRFVALLIIPMGVGIYFYSSLATRILLGNKWLEASNIIAIWGLTSSIKIVFCNLSSEVFRAKGKPKLSFIAQVLHLIVLVPTILITLNYGFMTFVYYRSIIRLQFVIINVIFINKITKITYNKMFKNVAPFLISASIMGIYVYYMKQLSNSLLLDILIIASSIILYSLLIMLSKNTRSEIINLYQMLVKSIKSRSMNR